MWGRVGLVPLDEGVEWYRDKTGKKKEARYQLFWGC